MGDYISKCQGYLEIEKKKNQRQSGIYAQNLGAFVHLISKNMNLWVFTIVRVW